eukprot:357435-Chlamydomonas_euryale.AAC.10
MQVEGEAAQHRTQARDKRAHASAEGSPAVEGSRSPAPEGSHNPAVAGTPAGIRPWRHASPVPGAAALSAAGIQR